MIVQGEYRERDLYRTYKEEGGPFNLTTLGGEQLLIEYDTETGLAGVAGGDYLAADLVGTDG